MEESSDIKKVLDSFSDSVSRGFTGTRDFIHKQVKVPIVVEDQKKTETLPKEPSAFPALMKTGGKLKYWKDGGHRLSRPSSNIDPELLERAKYDDSDFCGSFGWKTPIGKYAEGYLLKLDSFDQGLVDKIRLKQGEKVFRYINRQTAIGGMKPFIKINLEKDLLYFLDSFASEQGDTVFETRGVKADFINLIEGKFANGGRMEDYKGTITNDSAVHILKSLGFNFQYQHDSVTGTRFFGEFSKLKEAQNALYDTYRIETEIRGTNKMGLKELIVPNQMVDFGKGGTTMKKRYKVHTYHGGEQSDEIHYVDTLSEARKIASQAEHAEIIDQNSNEEVFAKGGTPNKMVILKDKFQQRADEPHRVYHSIEGMLGDYWFTAKTDNSHKHGYGSDGIKGGCVYQLDVWRGGNPVGRDNSTKGGHVSEDYLAGYDNKWGNTRPRSKEAKQVVESIVNWLEKNICDLKREWSSVKFKTGGQTDEWIENIRREDEYAKGGVTENLVKELHKLQRELNSSRLSTYKEGDNSPEEQARQRERASKLARFNEVLKLLNESGSKFAKGGTTQMPYYSNMTKQEILTKTVVYDNGGESMDRYTVFTPDGSVFGMSETAQGVNLYIGDDSEIEKGSHLGKRLKSVPKAIEWAVLDRMKEDTFKSGGEIEDEKSTFVVRAMSDLGEETYTVEATDGVKAFHEVRYLFKKENPNYKGELSLSMVDKYAKGGNIQQWIYWKILRGNDTLYERTHPFDPRIPNAIEITQEEYETNISNPSGAIKRVDFDNGEYTLTLENDGYNWYETEGGDNPPEGWGFNDYEGHLTSQQVAGELSDNYGGEFYVMNIYAKGGAVLTTFEETRVSIPNSVIGSKSQVQTKINVTYSKSYKQAQIETEFINSDTNVSFQNNKIVLTDGGVSHLYSAVDDLFYALSLNKATDFNYERESSSEYFEGAKANVTNHIQVTWSNAKKMATITSVIKDTKTGYAYSDAKIYLTHSGVSSLLSILDRLLHHILQFAKGGNIGGYSKIDLVVKKPSGDEEIEVAKFKRTGDAIISANALGKNAPKNYEYYVSSTNKYAKGGITPLLHKQVLNRVGQIYHEMGGKNQTDFEKAYDMAIKELGYTPKYYKSEMKKIGAEYGSDGDDFEYAKGGQISTGDWVTYKTDGKRYKVKRVLNNNMLEIASGSNVLIVSVDDVETTTKFYRAKFVKVPTNVQVSYKIGDRVKFATKKGEEKGVIKLYKYIPTTNKIMYVIKTDSGWNANVYQDNVALESSASTTTTPKSSKKATKTSASGFAKGDKVVVKDASNLSGIVTEVISANEVAVDVKDSLGITMKIGVITNMTFSTSELEKA